MSLIDYNKIAASVYQTVLNMNQVATDLVGLDCIWCRLLPYENAEDVVVQEYTLHSYECPKTLKVVTGKTDYLAGAYNIDLWGMHQELPLEINIDINTWKSIYGEGTMPLKGDFVLVQMIHKAFEVKSSVVVYTVGEQATSYKCILGQWQHNANRKETEEFHISIDELTVSQDRLFGDAISKEVADAVVEVETAYNTTSYVDPIKDFDMNSIKLDDALISINGNKFSEAYYDFTDAEQDVTYKVEATYDPAAKENHWIYSCWFRTTGENGIKSGAVKINKIYLQEKDYWWLDITSEIPIEEGDLVTIYRGGVIKVSGLIEAKSCESGYTLKLSACDCLKASSKVSNWWKSGNWKIQKYVSYNLFTCYNEDSATMKFDIDGSNLNIIIGNIKKSIMLTNGKALDYDDWYYLAIDLSNKDIRVVMVRNKVNESTGKHSNKVITDTTSSINTKKFMFNSAAIENKGLGFNICNIRLYENEYPLNDEYKLDMHSEVTRNASKLILVDAPNAANNMSFQTVLR